MWKAQLLASTEKFKHPAWGVSHSQRIYELSLQLAAEQGVDVDQDALWWVDRKTPSTLQTVWS